MVSRRVKKRALIAIGHKILWQYTISLKTKKNLRDSVTTLLKEYKKQNRILETKNKGIRIKNRKSIIKKNKGRFLLVVNPRV